MTVDYDLTLTLRCNGQGCTQSITEKVSSVASIAPKRWEMEIELEAKGWMKLKRGRHSAGHYCPNCLDKPIVPIPCKTKLSR